MNMAEVDIKSGEEVVDWKELRAETVDLRIGVYAESEGYSNTSRNAFRISVSSSFDGNLCGTT